MYIKFPMQKGMALAELATAKAAGSVQRSDGAIRPVVHSIAVR